MSGTGGSESRPATLTTGAPGRSGRQIPETGPVRSTSADGRFPDMAITDAGDHAAPPRTAAARTVDLVKTYGTGEARVDALAGVTVAIERAKFTAVMGPSAA